MKFEIIPPDPSIADFVNKFVLFSTEDTDTFYSEVVPTGYNYFNFGDMRQAIYHHPDRSVNLPSGFFVNGHLKNARVNVEIKGPFRIINCEIHPTGLYYLFDTPAKRFTDRYTSLGDLIHTGDAGLLFDKCITTETDADRVAIISSFIRENTAGKKADHYVDRCIEKIRSADGRITVEDLCDKSGVGRRQLEKKFREMAGISPGYFAGIIQFIATLRKLEETPDISLQDLAFEAGYYDLPHLMNSFKKFAGAWPSEYGELKKRYVEEIIK